jgi:hypothetical protein
VQLARGHLATLPDYLHVAEAKKGEWINDIDSNEGKEKLLVS